MKTIGSVAGVGIAAALSGCAGPLNAENQVGVRAEQWTPATISESMTRATDPDAVGTASYRDAPVYTGSGVYPPEAAEQSVTGIARDNWNMSVVAVPNDLAAHQPLYTNNVEFPDRSRRAQGKYPTAQSALDTGTSEGNDLQITEAFIAPFACAADVILFLPRLAFEARPGRPTRAGTTPYERVRQVTTGQPAPITPVGPAQPHFPAPATPESPEAKPGVPEAGR